MSVTMATRGGESGQGVPADTSQDDFCARVGHGGGRATAPRQHAAEDEAVTGKKAVVLLSGGLDSTTVLAIAKSAGYVPYALTFRYGQRQVVELDAATRVAAALGVSAHRIADIDTRFFAGSALIGDVAVPKDRQLDAVNSSPNATAATAAVPATYVPARNTLFLSYALAWAEVLSCQDLFIGVNAVDYSGYPDCRPEFVAAFARLANLATAASLQQGHRLRVHAPLMYLNKAEIITRGMHLGVDYGLTHSCYDPVNERACGRCDACVLRKRGFAAARVADPTRYNETGNR